MSGLGRPVQERKRRLLAVCCRLRLDLQVPYLTVATVSSGAAKEVSYATP